MVFQTGAGCYSRVAVEVLVIALLFDIVPQCTHARLQHSLRGLAQADMESASSAASSTSTPKATRTPGVGSTKGDGNTGGMGKGKGESPAKSMLQDLPANLAQQLQSIEAQHL